MKTCQGCLKNDRLHGCIAFNDPKYQLKREGGCYGRVENAEDLAKMFEDMAKYNEERGAIKAAKEFKRLARKWREKAKRSEKMAG